MLSLIAAMAAQALTCTPIAVDGDTLRCGRERIRLLAIDAPEMPGHCRKGRRCVRGNPFASKASLSEALRPPFRIRRVGLDRYGRTLATVAGARGDLSCWQLQARQARYRRDWDDGGMVERLCR
ncbi:thermonuclease family protein [Sphingomonas sp. SORGH_AS_0879]|uniref:thermonuclease family protein n=1 Tax=Sphingomonas sp. SORGH_AS_0879 TaxID=3041790 RepID=UPI00278B6744|nr:thermonuclease family protein [Sphingomonas sp. SORGH_AS_0879]MDQ1229287.1 micrococcal nuclease [Sphingomonas sp. SORGH_AS_0879]